MSSVHPEDNRFGERDTPEAERHAGRPWCSEHGLMAQGADGYYCEDCE